MNNNVIDEYDLSERLLKSLVKREFGDEVLNTNLEFGLDKITEILGRMHGNVEINIRDTLHEMVKLNKIYDLLEEYEKENVIFWMLCRTFGNSFDLEYSTDGVLINSRSGGSE